MRGHLLNPEAPAPVAKLREQGLHLTKDGQKMTYREPNRHIPESKVTNWVHPVDLLWMATGAVLLVLAAGLALCASWPAYNEALAETAYDVLIHIGAQLGAVLVLCGLVAAGGVR